MSSRDAESENPRPLNERRMLISTVGGDPKPLIVGLREAAPGRVWFVCTQEFKDNLEEIISSASDGLAGFGQGRCQPLILCSGARQTPAHEDLPNIVDQLHERLTPCVEAWLEHGDGEIFVDITGGTKTMSTALALWADSLEARVTYQYIGGERRAAEGHRVEPGAERPRVHTSPWQLTRLRVVRDYAKLFDACAFKQAIELISPYQQSVTSESDKRELNALNKLASTFAHWDLFDHGRAHVEIKHALKSKNDLSSALGRGSAAKLVIDTLDVLKERLAQLNRNPQDPSQERLLDLLANAERRHEEGRYDDATARSYRAIEAVAQLRLGEHGIDTKQVRREQVPADHRERFAAKFAGGEPTKFALQDAYSLLEALGDELGRRFRELDPPVDSRNTSILAHGWKRVNQKVAERLLCTAKQLAAELIGCADPGQLDLVRFPKLKQRR
jgi:CRISPR-associated protein (TIGR02710 family)